MTEPVSTRIAWRRMLAEGAVIVFSILLAFGVDAWWDGHTERRREAALLEDMLGEFNASRDDLASRVAGARRMAHGNDLLGGLVASAADGQVVRVPDSLIIAVIGGPTYEPASNALEAAVASGQIELIRNDEIQAELANWRRLGIDTREDELLVRELTTQHVVPLLAQEIELGSYFDQLLPWFFSESGVDFSGSVELRASRVLSGALDQRAFYTRFSADDLATMQASLDRLIALIEAELSR